MLMTFSKLDLMGPGLSKKIPNPFQWHYEKSVVKIKQLPCNNSDFTSTG